MTCSKSLASGALVLLALAVVPARRRRAAAHARRLCRQSADRSAIRSLRLWCSARGRGLRPCRAVAAARRQAARRALANGDAPSNPALADPGTGTFETLYGLLRLRPFADATQPRNALGFFIEGGGGATLTGKIVRPSVEAALGYGFPIGAFALAPALRYVQVVQPSDPLSDQDARVLLLGVELAFVDAQPAPVAVVQPAAVAKAAPVDTDGDGIIDSDDACRTEPEDKDGFQDDDGCPERDNDQDKIADVDDRCPNDPEDFDAFEDDDGCPDPDNDHDGFPDADDQCPLEAEVVNGNQDSDGCPDQGLIEMHNDRIVLEEEVLFDFERARVKNAARPVLDAIYKLYKQHPEWMKIRIEGHADQRGNEAFNQELSERRANNVLEHLVKLGIPQALIESAGYGSTRPRDKRDLEGAYQRNRRVEFVVVARGARPATPAAPAPAVAAPPAPTAPVPAATTAAPASSASPAPGGSR